MKELQAGIRQVKAKCIPLHRYPVFPQQESKPVTTKASQKKDSKQQFNQRPPLQRRSPIDKQAPSSNGTLPLHKRPKVGKKAAPLYKHPKLKKRVNSKKLLVSSGANSSLQQLQQRTNNALRRLGNQAERLNQLSAELEAVIIELKAIASEVNYNWKALQAIQKSTTNTIPPEVCEYQAVSVPTIQQKPCGSLVLTSRPVDVGKTEQEAGLMARTLRHRSRKKRLKG
ncbi:MAG: hypothetical protein F6K14_29140 [Symploca sp. SIO2C1]|nr:hypothetical protein [Symploca sp. SIO2C1]